MCNDYGGIPIGALDEDCMEEISNLDPNAEDYIGVISNATTLFKDELSYFIIPEDQMGEVCEVRDEQRQEILT